MEKKLYAIYIRETKNQKLLKDLLRKFLDFFGEFCTVDLMILEKRRYANKENRRGQGLDHWLY